jgi:Ca2+-binding RTX toxin-like protein
MAKPVTIQYFDAYVLGGSGASDVYMSTATKAKVDFIDLTTGNHVLLQGEDFKVSHGLVDRGRIESFRHFSEDGENFVKFSNLNIDARVVAGATPNEFLQDLLQRLTNRDVKVTGTDLDDPSIMGYRGNDRIFGRGGDDILAGAEGDDLLVGGLGNDTFQFEVGFEKDTIKDFDPTGGVGAQDFIQATFAQVDSINQVGANTVIDFGDGDTLTLLNVNASLITDADFVA